MQVDWSITLNIAGGWVDELTHRPASFLYSVPATNTVLSICPATNIVPAAEDVLVNNTRKDSCPQAVYILTWATIDTEQLWLVSKLLNLSETEDCCGKIGDPSKSRAEGACPGWWSDWASRSENDINKDVKEVKWATWLSGEVTFPAEVTARARSCVGVCLVLLRSRMEARAGGGEGTREKSLGEDKEALEPKRPCEDLVLHPQWDGHHRTFSKRKNKIK